MVDDELDDRTGRAGLGVRVRLDPDPRRCERPLVRGDGILVPLLVEGAGIGRAAGEADRLERAAQHEVAAADQQSVERQFAVLAAAGERPRGRRVAGGGGGQAHHGPNAVARPHEQRADRGSRGADVGDRVVRERVGDRHRPGAVRRGQLGVETRAARDEALRADRGGRVAEQCTVVRAGPDRRRKAVLIGAGEAGFDRGDGLELADLGIDLDRHGLRGHSRGRRGEDGDVLGVRVGRVPGVGRSRIGDRGLECARVRARDGPFGRGGPAVDGVVGLGLQRQEEERDEPARRVEDVLVGAPAHRHGRAAVDGEALEPPDEDEQLRDSVASDGAAAPP